MHLDWSRGRRVLRLFAWAALTVYLLSRPVPAVGDDDTATGDTVLNAGGPARTDTTRVDGGSRIDSSTAPVIELPEEVVQAPGIEFVPSRGSHVVVSGQQAERMPGGFADPARTLQLLPGVANDSDFDGLLFVRGGESEHNQLLLDQVSVTDPYHFGAVVSFLNTDVIDRIEFAPGGFGAQYGDAIGGIMRVDRRIGNPYQFHSSATITSTTLNGVAEGPIGSDGKSSWMVAGRRSHLDQVLSSRSVGQAQLPYFYDVDANLFRRLGNHQIKVGFLHSGDELAARLSDQFTFAPPDSGGLTWERELSMATLNWDYANESGRFAVEQAFGYSWRDQSVWMAGTLPQSAIADTRIFDWRADASLAAGGVQWTTGAQIAHTHTEYALDINQLTLEQNDRRSDPRSPLDTTRVESRFEGRNVYSAYYAQAEKSFFRSSVSVLFGTRFEHTSRGGSVEPTPRLRVEWRTPLRWVVSGAAGSYRQFPGHRVESDPTIGNPDLRRERARHITVGLAYPLFGTGLLSIEGYHKKLNDLIVLDSSAPEGSPRFLNSGRGVARGLEFLVHVPRSKWSAWASYTLGEVAYQDRADGESYNPAQDRRHLISAVFQVRPVRNWTFGLKWRASSGRPYTPVTGRADVSEFVEDVEWIPVEGAFHSARFPWYHRLDVRAERDFRISGARASAFLEVINLYGRKNLFDYRYVDGFGRAVPVQMMPLLPTFGISVSI